METDLVMVMGMVTDSVMGMVREHPHLLHRRPHRRRHSRGRRSDRPGVVARRA